MRSPWIDLLFLHGHVTPTNLAWRPDARVAEKADCVRVDVAELPLDTGEQSDCPSCA